MRAVPDAGWPGSQSRARCPQKAWATTVHGLRVRSPTVIGCRARSPVDSVSRWRYGVGPGSAVAAGVSPRARAPTARGTRNRRRMDVSMSHAPRMWNGSGARVSRKVGGDERAEGVQVVAALLDRDRRQAERAEDAAGRGIAVDG